MLKTILQPHSFIVTKLKDILWSFWDLYPLVLACRYQQAVITWPITIPFELSWALYVKAGIGS